MTHAKKCKKNICICKKHVENTVDIFFEHRVA